MDLKSKCESLSDYDYTKIAELLEFDFNTIVSEDRNGKFKNINDKFYKLMEQGENVSRFKLYVAELLEKVEIKEKYIEEISELKKVRKNIGSIITTNYDLFIENIFEFTPLIGNNILLSNPYGSIYKIHGCVTNPNKIILSSTDYLKFSEKYELIRAQLLSLFIHHPIIFLGYSISDDNIKNILKTIFTYIEPNSEQAKKVKENFLLVEYEQKSTNLQVVEHDIDMEGFATIRINKLKTDDYSTLYKALSKIILPISAMDIRKVQNVVGDIYAGGDIKVSITADIDNLKNSDKVLVIGTEKTINYTYETKNEMMKNYFEILEESNISRIKIIDKYVIPKNQYFPILGFNLLYNKLLKASELKHNQFINMMNILKGIKRKIKIIEYKNIDDILKTEKVSESNKHKTIVWAIYKKNIDLKSVEVYLRNFQNKNQTDYRRLLCLYDILKFATDDDFDTYQFFSIN